MKHMYRFIIGLIIGIPLSILAIAMCGRNGLLLLAIGVIAGAIFRTMDADFNERTKLKQPHQ